MDIVPIQLIRLRLYGERDPGSGREVEAASFADANQTLCRWAAAVPVSDREDVGVWVQWADGLGCGTVFRLGTDALLEDCVARILPKPARRARHGSAA